MLTDHYVKNLPKGPGVYLFKDVDGKVLYIGKATSLRARVQQYVSGQEEKSRGRRMRQLMDDAVSVNVYETTSALEALILEANLIKKYQPPYNIQQRDDKSYSYFLITKERFPRVLIMRETDFTKKKYATSAYTDGKRFGPYISRSHMQTALKILRKIFPFHDSVQQSEKGCLAYQIGLCPGPYDNAITPVQYRRNIHGIRMMLAGERTRLLASLRRAMVRAARVQEFEEAARLRDQIAALEHIRDISLMTQHFDSDVLLRNDEIDGRIECYDISHFGGESAVGAMVVFCGGVPEKESYRTFMIKDAQTDNDLAMMREVLVRRLNHKEWPLPQVVILDGGATHLAMAEEVWHTYGVTTPLMAVAKGPTRKNVDIYSSAQFPPPERILRNKVLIESLREEAHRYAIAFHKKRRKKDFLM